MMCFSGLSFTLSEKNNWKKILNMFGVCPRWIHVHIFICVFVKASVWYRVFLLFSKKIKKIKMQIFTEPGFRWLGKLICLAISRYSSFTSSPTPSARIINTQGRNLFGKNGVSLYSWQFLYFPQRFSFLPMNK